MCMNVLAYGEKAAGQRFKYWTHTVNVSAHGGVLVEDGTLATGQRFQLMNEYNRKKAECKVVSIRRGETARETSRLSLLVAARISGA